MDNSELICGIPKEILSKSFPGVHQSLFKFLFKNVPKVILERITPGKVPVKIEPLEIPESQPDYNCINLGEVQISDLKIEKFEDDPEDSYLESNCDIPNKKAPPKSHIQIKQESLTDTSSEIPEVKNPPESDWEDEDFSGANSDSSSGSDSEPTPKEIKPKKKYIYDKVKCDICQKSIVAHYIKTHIAAHLTNVKDRDRPFKCPEKGCDKTYFKNSHLNWHRKTCHNPKMKNIKEFKCDKCGKKFVKYSSYMSHIRACEPNQMCEFCPKIFNSRKELAKHRNTHTKEKSYECENCNAVFYRSECLLVHRKLHLNERRFPCKIKGCKSSFTIHAQLNNHIKTWHKRDVPDGLACIHCPKKFKKESTLYFHVNSVHKKERNFLFKCEVEGCGETFSGAAYLQKHQNDKHGRNPNSNKKYLCSKCGKSFESFTKWNNHEMKYCKILSKNV